MLQSEKVYLDQAFAITKVFSTRNSFVAVKAHEVQVELGLRLLDLPDHLHAQGLVEFHRGLGVFHPQHGVVELVDVNIVSGKGIKILLPYK